jgi:hypothetical protein
VAETGSQGVEDDGFRRGGAGGRGRSRGYQGTEFADEEDFEEFGDVVTVWLEIWFVLGKGIEDFPGRRILFFKFCLYHSVSPIPIK